MYHNQEGEGVTSAEMHDRNSNRNLDKHDIDKMK